jgi:hypothetical protein
VKIADKFRQQIANRPQVLLILAVVLHLGVATAVYEVGKHQLAPSQIFPTGVGNFASDGLMYERECLELSKVLRTEGLRAWATWPTQLHVRVYSLPFALSRADSFNIMTIEPVNLAYYLGILTLVFYIGKSLFGRASGLTAAAIIGFWPSFLLHTTQLLRDPLLILTIMVLCSTVIAVLGSKITWRRGLVCGIIGSAALLLIRIVRLPMWRLMLFVAALAIALLILRMILNRQVMVGAVVFTVLVGAAAIIIPKFQASFRNNQEVRIKGITKPEEWEGFSTEELIAIRRRAFRFHLDEEGNLMLAEDGSRIDRDVQFDDPVEIIKYLPRAAVVGFLAPFPNMWLNAGKQVGSGGRVLSGFEMIVTYVLECFALIGLVLTRRKLTSWFLFSVMMLGTVALGLVVNNIGALYRLRYPFWMMIVSFGAGGITHLLRHLLSKQAQAQTWVGSLLVGSQD